MISGLDPQTHPNRSEMAAPNPPQQKNKTTTKNRGSWEIVGFRSGGPVGHPQGVQGKNVRRPLGVTGVCFFFLSISLSSLNSLFLPQTPSWWAHETPKGGWPERKGHPTSHMMHQALRSKGYLLIRKADYPTRGCQTLPGSILRSAK